MIADLTVPCYYVLIGVLTPLTGPLLCTFTAARFFLKYWRPTNLKVVVWKLLKWLLRISTVKLFGPILGVFRGTHTSSGKDNKRLGLHTTSTILEDDPRKASRGLALR